MIQKTKNNATLRAEAKKAAEGFIKKRDLNV